MILILLSDYIHLYFYIHNVLVDASLSLLQVFLVELGNLRGISNQTLYLIHVDRFF